MTTIDAARPVENKRTLPIAVHAEVAAYGVVALVAVLLRAVQLGRLPLNAAEAQQALAAWRFVGGNADTIRSAADPLVFGGTALSIGLFGASNAAARLVPVLAGIGLVFSPLLFRRRLGHVGALAAAAWLALSPVAVSAARHLDGVGLSMLMLLLALAAADRMLTRRSYLAAMGAGAALAAALLADSGTLLALLALAVGWGFAVLTDEEDRLTRPILQETAARVPWGRLLAGFGGAAAVLATLFFAAPGGLGAAADQLTRFLGGFVQPTPGALPPLVALLLDQPGLIVFSLVGMWFVTQSAEPWQRALAGWLIGAVVLTFAYRGAEPAHALWMVVPMAALAGLAVQDLLAPQSRLASPWVVWGFAVGFVALYTMIFASLIRHLANPNILTYPFGVPAEAADLLIPLDLLLSALWVGMLIIVWLSEASFWNARSAWQSTAFAVLILAVFNMSGHSASLAFNDPASPYEPLNATPTQFGLDRLAGTAAEISRLTTGTPTDITITAQTGPDSAVAWALRDFRMLVITEHVDPTVSAALVVTPVSGVTDPALGSAYIGQDFVVAQSWQPRGLPFADMVRWVIYRRAPTEPSNERMILWVREDVYRLVEQGGTPGD